MAASERHIADAPRLRLVHDDPHSLIARIGNTPLLRLRAPRTPAVEIYAKAEWLNPGGSVKDRPVLAMLREAERNGGLRPGGRIIDATSGNSGIAYAMIGSALGYSVTLALPANAGAERVRTLKAYGARLILTDPGEGTDGAQRCVRAIVASSPGLFHYPDQYNNDANRRSHYETTGAEVWRQSAGAVTHFVAGLGTTGTFTGTARRLKEHDAGICCCAVQPDAPFHGIEGLKHLATADVPGIYDPSLVDRHFAVTTEDAYAEVRRLAREEGLLVGISSGAASAAAYRLADEIKTGFIVTIFPDGGSRYLSERFWER